MNNVNKKYEILHLSIDYALRKRIDQLKIGRASCRERV